MFKKYRLIVTLLIVGLIGGAFTQQVDASASAEDSTKGNDTQQYIVKHNHDQRWEMFIKKCFGKWYTNKHQHEAMNPQDENEQENQKQDEPKVPTTEQEDMQEQEKVEQPEQPKEEVEQPEEEVEQPEQQEQVDSDLHPFEQQVVELTNVERTKQGLAPLEIDKELSVVAKDKSKDMLNQQYFSHDSPTYGSPFDMMQAYGITYRTAGENIAKGQRSAEEVVNAWMNSPGHRENILNGNFTHIGVGYVEQGNYWTQQFIGK